MTRAVDVRFVRSHWREGPLADRLDAFADRMNAQGSAPYTAFRSSLLASCFGRWLKKEAIDLADIAPDHPAQYLRILQRRSGDRAGTTEPYSGRL